MSTKKLKVAVGSWAHAKLDVLEAEGYPYSGVYPTVELTMDEIFDLMRRFIEHPDVGVMLKPYTYGDQRDYTLWIDSAKGGFRTR